MTRFGIKAYFMHEHEEDAAKKAAADSVIESPEWTAGYVMGIVEESSIKALRKEGLVVTPIERLTEPAPAGDAVPGPDEIQMSRSAAGVGDILVRELADVFGADDVDHGI